MKIMGMRLVSMALLLTSALYNCGPSIEKQETPPKDPSQFFAWLKQASEAKWRKTKLNDEIYGFQIQAGTTWNPGLSDSEIARFELDIGFSFPSIYKLYLKAMNGTAKDTINIYGRSGEPEQYAPGFYSYPKDLPEMRKMIGWIYEECTVTPAEVEARQIPHIMPIYGHRFLVADRCGTNPVLSMSGDDIVSYAPDLLAFLVSDIFHDHAPAPGIPNDLVVKFWLNDRE